MSMILQSGCKFGRGKVLSEEYLPLKRLKKKLLVWSENKDQKFKLSLLKL